MAFRRDTSRRHAWKRWVADHRADLLDAGVPDWILADEIRWGKKRARPGRRRSSGMLFAAKRRPAGREAEQRRARTDGSGTVRAKTVPSPSAPPHWVVPYRVLPLSVKPARDMSPLLPLNEASTVGLPPLTGTLNTVPYAIRAAFIGRAVQGVAAERQAGKGLVAVAAVERGEHRGAATAHGNAEDRAVAVWHRRSSVVPYRVLPSAERQAGQWITRRCCR